MTKLSSSIAFVEDEVISLIDKSESVPNSILLYRRLIVRVSKVSRKSQTTRRIEACFGFSLSAQLEIASCFLSLPKGISWPKPV